MQFFRLLCILLATLQSIVISSAIAEAYHVVAKGLPVQETNINVHLDKRLRSAIILRTSKQDSVLRPATAEANVLLLQKHFDAVLEVLDSNKTRALKTALDRLERQRPEKWTEVERAKWLQYLSFQRRLQIIRLQRYRLRGLFPQNEHDSNRAVPVFVDNYGTHCAVGYLMRESGWGKVVNAIAARNNLIYLTDVKRGPIISWIAYSGLTREEAALIQPGYSGPPLDTLLSDLGESGSVSHGGLRYENFSLSASGSGFPFPFPFPFPIPGELEVPLAGFAVDNEIYYDPEYGNQLSTRYEDWLVFVAPLSTDSLEGNAGTIHLVYTYDVVVEAPGGKLVAGSIRNQPIFNVNDVNIDGYDHPHLGRIDIDTVIRALSADGQGSIGSILASLHFNSEGDANGNHFFFGDDYGEFAAQEAIRVETTVRMENSAQFDSLIHSFQLVPEPTSLVLAIAMSFSLVLLRDF